MFSLISYHLEFFHTKAISHNSKKRKRSIRNAYKTESCKSCLNFCFFLPVIKIHVSKEAISFDGQFLNKSLLLTLADQPSILSIFFMVVWVDFADDVIRFSLLSHGAPVSIAITIAIKKRTSMNFEWFPFCQFYKVWFFGHSLLNLTLFL